MRDPFSTKVNLIFSVFINDKEFNDQEIFVVVITIISDKFCGCSSIPFLANFSTDVLSTLEKTSTCCDATATLVISLSWPESLISF